VSTLELTVTAAFAQAKGTLVWRGPPAESVGVFEQLLPERAWGANNKKWRRLQEEDTKENIALMYDNPSDFILDCLVGLEAEDIASMKAQFTDAPMTDVVYDTDKEEQQQVGLAGHAQILLTHCHL
jgi:hypothetical protein